MTAFFKHYKMCTLLHRCDRVRTKFGRKPRPKTHDTVTETVVRLLRYRLEGMSRFDAPWHGYLGPGYPPDTEKR